MASTNYRYLLTLSLILGLFTSSYGQVEKGDNILGFTVSNEAHSGSSTKIDEGTPDTLDIDVIDSSEGNAVVSYFTVNVGADNKLSDWTINFVVKKGSKKTGKWVFTKGKSDDDIVPK